MKNGGCVERTRVIQLHYSQIIGSFEDNIVEQPHILSYRDPLPPSLPPSRGIRSDSLPPSLAEIEIVFIKISSPKKKGKETMFESQFRDSSYSRSSIGESLSILRVVIKELLETNFSALGRSPNPGTGSRVSSTRVQRTRTTAEGEKTGYEGNRERSRGRGRGRESIIFELQTCYIRRGGGVTLCG